MFRISCSSEILIKILDAFLGKNKDLRKKSADSQLSNDKFFTNHFLILNIEIN